MASDSKISSPLVISAVAAAVGVLLAIFVSQALVDSARRDIDAKLAEAGNAADAMTDRVSAIEDSVRGLDRDEIQSLGGQVSALEKSLGDIRGGTASLHDEIAVLSSGLASLEGFMVDPKAFAALVKDTATIQERLAGRRGNRRTPERDRRPVRRACQGADGYGQGRGVGAAWQPGRFA